MGMKDVKNWVYPNGEEGLLSDGPIAPGPGEIQVPGQWTGEEEAREAAENMLGIAEALEPQIGRERSRREAEAKSAEDRARDAPLKVYLQELAELLSSAGEDSDEPIEGRNEVEFILLKTERVEGGKEKTFMVLKETRTPEQAMHEGMPDLEGKALAYAREKVLFGSYLWRVRAWLKGECIKQHNFRINIAEPPGFKVERKKNPMEEIEATLKLVKTFREALGTGGGGGDNDKSAALLAKIEAMEVHRREIRDMEERFERKLKEFEKEVYEKGRADGEREAKLVYERRIWELERDVERAEEGNPKADLVDKVVSLAGGPAAVQGLIGAIAQAAAVPKNARETRTPRPYQGPVMRPRPMARPVRPLEPKGEIPSSSPVLPLPDLQEKGEALETMHEAMDALRAAPESSSAEIQALISGFDGQIQAGLSLQGQDLAGWWAALHEPTFASVGGGKLTWLQLAEQLLEAEGEEEQMTVEDLKGLLVQRLEEGLEPGEILGELNSTVPEATRQEWKGYLRWMPVSGALGFLGIPEEHSERGTALLEMFKAS